MALSIQVPENYGYVVLVALGLIPVWSFLQGEVTGRFRKAAKVPYPNAYATHQQAKESREVHQFNCAQRAHGNLMENMPQTMVTSLVAGLSYPLVTAGLGVGWVLFRGVYTYGYVMSDDPKGRAMGAGFWLCQGGIWGLSAYTALKLI